MPAVVAERVGQDRKLYFLDLLRAGELLTLVTDIPAQKVLSVLCHPEDVFAELSVFPEEALGNEIYDPRYDLARYACSVRARNWALKFIEDRAYEPRGAFNLKVIDWPVRCNYQEIGSLFVAHFDTAEHLEDYMATVFFAQELAPHFDVVFAEAA